MSETQAFGPNLRRARLKSGVSLDQIARHTKISVELWEAMEENDFRRWPRGIYARAFIREYAQMIGADPDAVVEEFCRRFPHGDRRAERLVRDQADLLQHPLVWRGDVLPAGQRDRRRSGSTSEVKRVLESRLSQRLIAAGLDAGAVLIISALIATPLPIGFWAALAVVGALYHGVSLIVAGTTPAAWALEAHVSSHFPQLWRRRGPIFLRFGKQPDES